MRRRALLAAGTAAVAGVAGCLGDDDPRDLGAIPDPSVSDAGLAPDAETVPEPDVDTDAWETIAIEETEVALVPLSVAVAWYRRRDARFVDARGQERYDAARVPGVALSPAPDGREGDPTGEWPQDERIVTYCVCPHTLAGMRDGRLRDDGHAGVFALEPGIEPWIREGHPVEGDAIDALVDADWTVAGTVDPEFAGDLARVRHEPTRQFEATPIEVDGSFEVDVPFVGVDDETPVTLETPAFALTAPIGDLSAAPVTAP